MAAFAAGALAATAVASVRGQWARGLRVLAADQLSGLRYANQPAPDQVMTTDLIANVAAKAEPAVVAVTAHIPGSHAKAGLFAKPTPAETSTGSGFLITPSGYILTNDHVIENATSIRVAVNGISKPLAARVVGASFALDLAVLKVSASRPLPTLPLGNSSETRVGQWDIAIGNPYGLANTLTVGVISAEGRPLTIGSRNYQDLLQTDAPINPGNSGGPLLNLAGQVIGINTAVQASGQGLGFAIPIDTARRVLPDLMTKGYVPRPWMGVGISTDSASVAKAYGLSVAHGAVVVQVLANSPAARAGVRVDDVILSIDGHAVTGAKGLVKTVLGEAVGRTVRVRLARGRKRLTLRVRLVQEPNDLPEGSGG